jgi:thiamine-monophosphate kinase
LSDQTQARNWALGGGDDYELCFTAAPEKMPELGMLIASGQLQATVVGTLVPGSGVRCQLHGENFEPDHKGYTHF